MYIDQNLREDTDNKLQCLSSEFKGNCANCILMKEQLYIVQLKLESAITAIAHLHDCISEVTAQDFSNIVKPSFSNKQGIKNLDDEKLISVDHSLNKRPKGHTASLAKCDHAICSSNRFAPLSNLNENSTDEVVLKCINEGFIPSGSTDNAINQPIKDNRIPTIINGRVTNGHIKKLTKTLVNSPRNFKDILNKFNHKVKIIGDSCLKELSTRLNQYLNTKFEYVAFSNLEQVLSNS
jgi:hypothetical protein